MDFTQIALLVVAAATAGIIARLIKQPLLIGYIFAGFLLSLLGFIPHSEGLSELGQIGVTLLLFLVGLEMKLSEIKTIGKIALLTGIAQIVFTSSIGFLLAMLFGFSTLASVYIAIALTFSSTIIIIKLLSEKRDLGSLYGKIAVGFLLVQDLVAVLILMFLAGLSTGDLSTQNIALMVIKGSALLLGMIVLSKYILPPLFSKIIDKSQELLFIAGIAWALGIALLVEGPLGFSLEIGGFLAGLALSNLPDHTQLAAKTKPLRDFFLTLFFLLLGTNLVTGSLGAVLIPSIVFSAFVLIGNPLIVMAVMGALGHKKRTSFLASVTVAQTSEFSLILMAMGLTLGHVTDSEVAMLILVSIITMTASTYLILGSEKVYEFIKPALSIFERKKTTEIVFGDGQELKDHIILIGCDRTGRTLLPLLKKQSRDFIVIDFNPDIINKLSKRRIPCIFGDSMDPEIMELAQLDKASLVISTTTDPADSKVLLQNLKRKKNKPVVILKANNQKEALEYYQRGASYVIVPEITAGEHLKHLLKMYGIKSKRISELGASHERKIKRFLEKK